MPPLDLDKVREAYFNPVPDNPGRPLTREEMYARFERRRVETHREFGLDVREAGLGEHGSLIGGTGKPLTVFHADPERALRIPPPPISWFDHARGRQRLPPPGGVEGANQFFAGLAAGHLAGMRDRPSGERLRCLFRARSLSGLERSQVWHVFACIRDCELPRLRWRGGLSAYEIARAALLSKTRRATLTCWLYQYALDPENPSAPQSWIVDCGY